MKNVIKTKTPSGRLRTRVFEDFKDENGELLTSKTDPSFQNDCDINFIVSRFKKTGQVSHLAKSTGIYADVSGFTDLLDMHTKLREAQFAFDSLPATLRERLENDPTRLPEFLNDPENSELLIDLGILIPENGSKYSSSRKSSTELKNEPKNAKTKTPTKTTTTNDDESVGD